MRPIVKWIALGSFVAGVVVQLYPQLERDNPAVTGEIEAPAEVVKVLRGLPPRYQDYFIDRIVERVEKSEMPPRRHSLLHPSAKVNPDVLEVLRRWRSEKEKGGP